MEKEIIELVSRFMRGDRNPLESRANAVANANPTDADQENNAIKGYAERAIVTIKKTMPFDHHISGFDGTGIQVQCSNPSHPSQTVPVYGNLAWLQGPKQKKETIAVWPSLFAVNPAIKIKACQLCEEERRNPLVEYKAVCRAHQCILPASMECPECKSGPSLFALDSRSITLVRRDPTAAVYDCPMHGVYSVGHRAKNHGCIECAKYKAIAAYGTTFERSNHEALKRLKAHAYPIVCKHLRRAKYDPALSPYKISLIQALVKRCYDPNNNMHLLHIFPSEAFIEGSWLVEHQKHIAFAEAAQEYLMPRPQDLIDPIGGQKAVLIEEATILCDSQWRTAHWSRHKEFG